MDIYGEDAIANYRNVVEQPWGKMFYDLLFEQLALPQDQRLRILDFGAGFFNHLIFVRNASV